MIFTEKLDFDAQKFLGGFFGSPAHYPTPKTPNFLIISSKFFKHCSTFLKKNWTLSPFMKKVFSKIFLFCKGSLKNSKQQNSYVTWKCLNFPFAHNSQETGGGIKSCPNLEPRMFKTPRNTKVEIKMLKFFHKCLNFPSQKQPRCLASASQISPRHFSQQLLHYKFSLFFALFFQREYKNTFKPRECHLWNAIWEKIMQLG